MKVNFEKCLTNGEFQKVRVKIPVCLHLWKANLEMTSFGFNKTTQQQGSGGFGFSSGGFGSGSFGTMTGNNAFGNQKTSFGQQSTTTTSTGGGFSGFGTNNSSFGNKTSGFGNFNFATQQPQQPTVDTPISTIGVVFQPRKVNLPVKFPMEGKPSEMDFEVQHISQYDIFSKFTIEEMRYYDYLRNGSIVKSKTNSMFTNTSISSFNNQSTQNQAFAQNNNQNGLVSVSVPPWRKKPDPIKPPENNQTQPFGALPATTLSAPQVDADDDDDIQAPPEIPIDVGFRDTLSIYDSILQANPSYSATPGIWQLNARRVKQ